MKRGIIEIKNDGKDVPWIFSTIFLHLLDKLLKVLFVNVQKTFNSGPRWENVDLSNDNLPNAILPNAILPSMVRLMSVHLLLCQFA